MWTHPWPFDRQGGPSYDFEPRERKRFQHERCALLGSPPDGDCIGCVDIGRHWLLVEGAGPFIVVDWSCYQVHGSGAPSWGLPPWCLTKELKSRPGQETLLSLKHSLRHAAGMQKSLKSSERQQAASRIWARLTGPARAVVRHLDPDDYEADDGLSRLVDVLRKSPLQALPIADSFKRLDAWHMLKRLPGESIPKLLVREEDMFVQLQSALTRAREDRGLLAPPMIQQVTGRGPPSTPSQSPMAGMRFVEHERTDPVVSTPQAQPAYMPDFFEDELRGYRLLKAAKLTSSEKQNILTQTGNSTGFLQIRRALRKLFAEEEESQHWGRKPKIWWQQEDAGWDEFDEAPGNWEHDPSPSSWEDGEEEAYWNWTSDWQDDAGEWDWAVEDESIPHEEGQDPAEQQLREAYALAGEANRTLAEARDAVRRVRQARGYFAPESATGKGSATKGIGKGKGKSKSFGGKSNSGGKGRSFGPCFVCRMQGHSYKDCPDRFSKGGGKSFARSSFGRSPGKGSGKAVQFHSLSVTPGIFMSDVTEGTRVIVDTGASENAVGADSLQQLLEQSGLIYTVDVHDRPVFKFGNGHQAQALSRADIQGTSIGAVSYYVLGHDATQTPPLLGGKTLRQLGAMLAYDNDLFIYRGQDPQKTSWYAVKMGAHHTHHFSLDLVETATVMENPHMWFATTTPTLAVDEQLNDPDKGIYMFTASCTSPSMPTSDLAQRLRDLQLRLRDGKQPSSTMWQSRPTVDRVAMQCTPQDGQDPAQPVRELVDMRSLWTQADVRGQAQGPWGDKVRRTPSESGSPGSGSAPAVNVSERLRGEDRHGQGDGVEGPPDAERSDGDHGNQPHLQLPGVCQADGSPGGEQDIAAGSAILSAERGKSEEKERRSWDCSVRPDPHGRSGLPAQEDRHGLPRSGGLQGCSGSPHCQGSRGGTRNAEDTGQDRGQDEDLQEEGGDGASGHLFIGGGEGDSGQGLKGIWAALKSLQRRLKGSVESPTTPTCTTSTTTPVDEHASPSSQPRSAIQFQGSHRDDSASRHQGNLVEEQLPFPGRGGGKKHGVPPSTARKLAANSAMLSAMMVMSVRGLFGQLSSGTDFVEIACSPTSSMTTAMEELGHHCTRVNFKSGYDLEKKSGTTALSQMIKEKRPRHAWVSLPCTRLTGLVNLTMRNEVEEAAFQKRQGRDLRRADEVVQAVEPMLEAGDDVSWEWPTGAKKGWRSNAIQRLERLARRHGRRLYWCHFHGCAYGLQWRGHPVQTMPPGHV